MHLSFFSPDIPEEPGASICSVVLLSSYHSSLHADRFVIFHSNDELSHFGKAL